MPYAEQAWDSIPNVCLLEPYSSAPSWRLLTHHSIHVRCTLQTCWTPSSTDVRDCSQASVLNLGTAIHGLDQLIPKLLLKLECRISSIKPQHGPRAAGLSTSDKSLHSHIEREGHSRESRSCPSDLPKGAPPAVETGHKHFL